MLLKGAMQAAPRQPARAGITTVCPSPAAAAAAAAVLHTCTALPAPRGGAAPVGSAASSRLPAAFAPTIPRGAASPAAAGGPAATPMWVCSAAAAVAPTAVEARGTEDTGLQRYRCHSKEGAVVDAVVDSRDGRVIAVRITASYDNVPHRAPSELLLHWGMYRASGTKWHHPREAVPPGSSPEPGGSGAMRTAMRWDERAGVWAGVFEVPAKLAPLHLAFALYHPARDKYDNPLRAPHFCVPVGMSAGRPEPLGASVVSVAASPQHGGGGEPTDPRDIACAVNFSVFSRHASSLQLCLVRVKVPSPEEVAAGGDGAAGAAGEVEPLVAQSVLEVVLDPLTNRTGDVWHICVHGLKDLESLCWAWRADGEILWQNGNRFHPGFMLMDPWATRAVPVLLPEGAHKAAPRLAPAQPPGEPVLLGSLAGFVHAPFDWAGAAAAVRGGQSRVRALEEGVVLELDVGSFTSGPDVPPERRGKYLGILDRLDHLKAVGVTCVMLAPVSLGAAGPEGGPRRPLALFAPDPAYAVGGPLAAAAELKTAIRGLHRAGIEVVMQVEFCLTAEGGDASSGRLQGLRGLDHAVYYRDGLEAPVLNCGHPVVRSLVVSALRHWAAEYRVEGFCFLNAENLAQDKFGSVLDNPPLAEEIAGDPVLRNLKLIAAVSNPALLPRSAERGFPHWGVWMQLNDRFAADLTAYLAAGQRGTLSAVATRLTGSPDLFAARWDAGLPGGLAAGRRPAFGLNAAAPLGDRPLVAAVAAAAGAAGAAADAARCEAVSRALLLAQFVAAGQPLVAASTLARPAAAQLVAALAAVRRGYRPLLSPPSLTSAERVLTWHSPYAGGGEPDWAGANPDAAANALVLTIGGGAARPGHLLAVAFNPAGEPVTVALPRPPTGAVWRLLVDTARPVPTAQAAGGGSLGAVLPAEEQGSYVMGPYGAVLLDAVPVAAAASAAAAAASVASRPTAAAAAAPPPPGYGLSPAAAAAAAASRPQTQAYKATGGGFRPAGSS
ncbi:hypothetical protein PLESTB_000369500 [Pleodorina starrii]|uniref:Uncharacterized protein n=1 Tax=Pleodorina starrii TaxID=330485 RepID=A0A9W6BEJ6_9CHLO|nr:hypothetical protein PLESTM_000025400 [Pleodorina starrii]GLC50350.1 hypothetical protein PLESTB_000369500 [Pleodorina starrii]GLC64268.1 hypothetical protein PLESTF_000143200 [Pleodorina starrii]